MESTSRIWCVVPNMPRPLSRGGRVHPQHPPAAILHCRMNQRRRGFAQHYEVELAMHDSSTLVSNLGLIPRFRGSGGGQFLRMDDGHTATI